MQELVRTALAATSIDIDANYIAHRSATAAIARYDQTQCVTRQRGAVHVVRDLNLSASELRGDLCEGNHGNVSVRAGNTDSKVHLIGRLRGIDRPGINENVPKKRASPVALLLATTRHEADALSEARQLGDSFEGNRSRGRPGALYENSPRGRRRLDQRHRIKTVLLQDRLTGLR
jgi:hypothetical protein